MAKEGCVGDEGGDEEEESEGGAPGGDAGSTNSAVAFPSEGRGGSWFKSIEEVTYTK